MPNLKKKQKTNPTTHSHSIAPLEFKRRYKISSIKHPDKALREETSAKLVFDIIGFKFLRY